MRTVPYCGMQIPETDGGGVRVGLLCPESCRLVGRIVNVSDDSVLDDNGKVDIVKVQPITFEPMNNQYLVPREMVGQAFHDDITLR